jgi:hypothetical protein
MRFGGLSLLGTQKIPENQRTYFSFYWHSSFRGPGFFGHKPSVVAKFKAL